MITEQELLDAIAECQGQRNPNANTCIKLASFYTILDHIKKEEEAVPMYSFAAPMIESPSYNSGTEFSDRIQNLDINEVLEVIDDLMTTLSIVNPRLYAGVIRRL